jgi:sterol desaturase/sphingolipid hydroxylase (fatty acid hydroxylase superfamily)
VNRSPRRKRPAVVALTATVLAVPVVIRYPSVALSFVVLFPLFALLERRFALRPQRIFRAGWACDAAHFFLNVIPGALLVAVLLATVGTMLRGVVPFGLRTTIAAQPVLVQLVGTFLLSELGMYWSHRIEHELPFFWRFHAVHHSSPQLDWLSTQRTHPVDGAIRKLFIIPVYALGFSATCVAIYFVVYYFWSFLEHANIRVRFGPLRWIMASPEFHHWHHADEPSAVNKNYAPLLPVFDVLFGTCHLPRRMPAAYGTPEPVPSGYLGQIAYPFRAHPAVLDQS